MLVFVATTQLHAQQMICAGSEPHQYIISGSEGMSFNWHVKDGEVLNKDTLNDTIWITWPNGGNFKISVDGKLNGCIVTSKLDIHVLPRISVDIGPDKVLCPGQEYTFEVDTGYKLVRWHNSTTDYFYTATTNDTVSVRVTDKDGCSASDMAYVFMHPNPIINLNNERDTSLCGEALLTLDAGNPGSNYSWSGLDPYMDSLSRIVYVRKENRIVSVKVTDEFGCYAFDTIKISNCNEEIPSVFTPNRDGYNDTWKIPVLAYYPNAVVEIYDRWGRVIFRSEKGYPRPWDGTFNNRELPTDAYFYVINYNEKDKAPSVGSITIIK